MRSVVFGAAVCLSILFSCRASESSGDSIVLGVSLSKASKADALAAGDEVAVYAMADGAQTYFLTAHKFAVGSDGQTLTAQPAAHYPDAVQAVAFYACFPYHTGSFGVPADQSTAEALKAADLCWATTQSTPSNTPVPLPFNHVLARLVVMCSAPTSKILASSAFSGGSLDIKTGLFTNATRSDVSTTQNELILPAQTLNRIAIVSGGEEYTFEGSVSLEAGKTTTLNLTLHASTHTASLDGSSTAEWTTRSGEGSPTETASNVLTLHWVPAHAEATSVDKVVLTIEDDGGTADYAVSSGVVWNGESFEVPFALLSVRYPYTIKTAAIYKGSTSLLAASSLVGATVYKQGAFAVGVKAGNPINPPSPSDYVKIGNLYWAKGNLVATSSTPGPNNGCKVGDPYDGGLYFQFGSLIGWKGGALANGGTGVGQPLLAYNQKWWNGATKYSWSNDAMVWPTSMTSTPTAWPYKSGSNLSTLSGYYFDYSYAPWETVEKDIRMFAVSVVGDTGSGTLATGRYAALGVGDPCTYYLGGTWRLPTTAEYKTLCNNQGGYGQAIAWSSCNASWKPTAPTGGNFSGSTLFLPASGFRYDIGGGAFRNVTGDANCWTSSINSAKNSFFFNFNSGWVHPQIYNDRSGGFPVRCVSEAP